MFITYTRGHGFHTQADINALQPIRENVSLK